MKKHGFFLFLSFIVIMAACNKPIAAPATIISSGGGGVSAPAVIASKPEPAPVPHAEVLPVIPKTETNPGTVLYVKPSVNKSTIPGFTRLSKKEVAFELGSKVAAVDSGICIPPAAPSIPLHVVHPKHFYALVWSQVSITLGNSLPVNSNNISINSTAPVAVAYSISLRGIPADHFVISQTEQIVSAPTDSILSSTAYFDVKPLKSGKKKLVYQIKARASVTDPGVGLPQVEKDIVVEVNGQTWKQRLLTFGVFLLGLGGAALTTYAGLLVKKWFDNKNK